MSEDNNKVESALYCEKGATSRGGPQLRPYAAEGRLLKPDSQRPWMNVIPTATYTAPK